MDKALKEAIATFPATFGLRAFGGDTFRVSRRASYTSDEGPVIYVEVLRRGEWFDFAKGAPATLHRELVPAPAGRGW